MLILIIAPLSAASDPTWYSISIQELAIGGNLYNNSIDLFKFPSLNIQFAQVLTKLNATPTPGYENLRIEVVIPDGQMRFVLMGDPTKWVTYELSVQHGQTPEVYPSVFPYSLTITPGTVGTTDTTTFSMRNFSPPNSGISWRGTYHTQLHIRVLDADNVLLREQIHQLYVYFRTIDTNGIPFTLLTLERYPSSDNINLPQMQLDQSSLAVGSVNFQSNDSSISSSYSLRIEPYPAVLGNFTFNRSTDNGYPISYKVHISGRTIPAPTAFSTNVTSKGATGYWQDTIELAVSAMNYSTVPMNAGAYTSSLRISLIKN